MAQTGFTPIQLYSSSTTGNTPAAADLLNSSGGSELAINIFDGKLFYKDSSGNVQVIGWKVVPVSAGGTGQTSYTDGQLLIGNSTGNTLAKSTLTAGSGIAITNGAGAITISATGGTGTVTSVSGTAPISVATGTTTPVISISQSGVATDGYLSSTDWNTFNGKAPATTGTAILYGNGTGGFSSVTIGTGVTFAAGTLSATGSGGDVVGPASSTDNAIARFDLATGKLIQNSGVIIDDSNNVSGVNTLTTTNLIVNDDTTLGGSNADSVAVNGRITTDLEPATNNAKDIGTSGRNWRDGFFGRNLDTVNLSVTGTTSFDGSQGTSGQVLTSAGTGATPTWTTPTTGTVTSVAALTLGTTGTDLSSTVANGTTTPVITLNVPTASATNRGALSSTDWSTFNGKQAALVSGTNIKTVSGVSLLGSGDVGTIGTGYGGTGLTSFTSGGIPYATSTSALTTGSALTFNGTSLGVTGNINVSTSGGASYASFSNGTSAAYVGVEGTSSNYFGATSGATVLAANTGYPLQFTRSGVSFATFNSVGNFGLGLTPSTWQTGTKAIEIGSTGSALYSYASNFLILVNNATYNGTNWIYSQSGQSPAYYALSGGQHQWNTASSGTAGNSVTFTQAMTLFPSGGVSIGNTSDPGAGNLSVTGNVIIPSSNANTTDKYLSLTSPNFTAGSQVKYSIKSTGASGGDWGIGWQTNAGGQPYMYFNLNGAHGIAFQRNNANGVELTGTNTAWAAYSDVRLKEITGVYDTPLDDIMQLEAIKFTWKSDVDKKPCVGLSAQSVQKVIPEAVDESYLSSGDDDQKYLKLKSTEVIPLLVASIQQLKKDFDAYIASHP